MKGLMAFMEKYFIPVAAKIGSQKHLVAIRDGFVTIMPLIIAGSFGSLFINLPIQPYQDMMNSIFGGAQWKELGLDMYYATFGVMSLLVVFSVAYSLAKSYDSDGLATGVVCFSALMALYTRNPDAIGGGYPGGFLGSTGLFVALGVALLGGTIFVKLLGNPKLVIKMPEGVPPAVAKSFAALFPGFIVVVLACAVHQICLYFGIDNIHQSIAWTIQGPFASLGGSIVGLLVIVFFTQLLWFFGLHGSNILLPIVNTLFLPLTNENIDIFTKTGDITKVPNVVNSAFLDGFVNLGGSGATICLVLAIFLVSKNKAQKAIAGISAAPGLFNINEPIQFGLPVVLNPMFLIPFIVVPFVCAVIAYFATTAGLIPPVVVLAPWTTPPVIGAFLMTGANVMGGVVALVNIVVGTLIYMPFVIANDKKMAAEAAEALEA